jgi:AcrR family transcriptional regulator
MGDHVKRSSSKPVVRDARRDRWRMHRAARREEFLDAALRALAKHGPDVGMEHVAAEAGVTKPVLYRHFTDKADLFLALGHRGTELLFQRLIPALNNEEAPVPRIRKSLDAFFSIVDEYPNLYRLLIRRSFADRHHDVGADVLASGASTKDIVAEDKELIGNALSALLGDYMRALDLDSGAAEPWAHGIVGLVQNVSEWWLERQTMSRDAVVEYLTQIIWAAIDGITRQHGIVLDPNNPLEVNKVVKLAPRQTAEPGA